MAAPIFEIDSPSEGDSHRHYLPKLGSDNVEVVDKVRTDVGGTSRMISSATLSTNDSFSSEQSAVSPDRLSSDNGFDSESVEASEDSVQSDENSHCITPPPSLHRRAEVPTPHDSELSPNSHTSKHVSPHDPQQISFAMTILNIFVRLINKGPRPCEKDPRWHKLTPEYQGVLKERGIWLSDLMESEIGDHGVYVPWVYARRLWCSSWTLALPVILGFVLKVQLALAGLFVFATSINHWRKPRCGWRRRTDIAGVVTAIVLHSIAAYGILEVNPAVGQFWFSCAGMAILSYATGRIFGISGNHNIGTRFHLTLHLLGAVGNTILYYQLGTMPQPGSELSAEL